MKSHRVLGFLALTACLALCASHAHARRPAARLAQAAALPEPVRQALAKSRIRPGGLTLYALCLDGDDAERPLVAYNEEKSLALASTAKIVTTLAALDLLSADYRWGTYAYLLGPLNEGRLDGDLLIVGGGDATLTADVLRAWFEELRRLGLREIGGNILLDRGAFRLQPDDFSGTPVPSPRRPEHARPDAFSLRAATPRLALGKRRQAPLAALVSQPATSPLREMSGGGVAPGATPNLAELALLAAGPATSRTITALWTHVGGVLHGRVVERKGGPPDALPLDADGERMLPFSVHHSASLAELLRGINKWSDNLAARNLMLTLSEGFPLRAATLPDAKQRLQAWLAEQGLGEDDIAVDSGSGLSRAERGRARALAQLLRHAWHRPGADAFVDSLPVAGVDGTLTHRLQDGDAAGRAFLKTGTLNDARALAGYVQGRSGKRYAVVAIVNDVRARAAVPVLDAFIEWVAHNG